MEKKNKKGKTAKLLVRPKAKLVKELDAVKTVLKGGSNTRFTTEGKIGHFDLEREFEAERVSFLGRYSL